MMPEASLPARVRRTLRLEPAEALSVFRRKAAGATRRAGRTWTRIAPQVPRIGPARHAVSATYFAVVDGHTLNLQAAVPLDGPAPATADVVFRQARFEHRASATLRAGDRRWYLEATVLLGSRPAGIPLGPGAWQVSVLLTQPSGECRRVPVRAPAARPDRRGPAVAFRACPDTGTEFRPGMSSLGTCRITVRPGQPRAEVVRCTVALGRAEVLGRFVGAGDTAGCVADFRRRGDGAVHTASVTMRDGFFAVTAPLADMAPARGAEDVWEIEVRLRAGRRLPLGRFLHDLPDVRRVLRSYERRIPAADGTAFRLRPGYTSTGRFTLTCTADSGDHE